MNIDFVQALKDIQKEKDIPLDVLSEIVEAALVSAYRKHYGSDAELHVEIDWDESRISVYMRKQVVETVEDPHIQIGLADARAAMPQAGPGDYLDIEVPP